MGLWGSLKDRGIRLVKRIPLEPDYGDFDHAVRAELDRARVLAILRGCQGFLREVLEGRPADKAWAQELYTKIRSQILDLESYVDKTVK